MYWPKVLYLYTKLYNIIKAMEKSIISFRQPFYQQYTVHVFNEYRFGLD